MRTGWALWLAVVSVPALAAGEAADWLVRISEASRIANYRGVIVYQARDTQETLRVVHRFQDGVEMERVQTLTGLPREIIKQDDRVICLLPRDRRVTVDRPTPKSLFPGLTLERVTQIGQVYEFDDLGQARIAGRNCRGIAIMPRDDYRYGYEVWADELTAVPLKVNLIGRDGGVLEQMMFTQVEFPDRIPDTALQSELDPQQRFARLPVPVPAAAVPAIAVAPSVVPLPQQPVVTVRLDRLPPGFKVVQRDLRPTADGKGVVEHLLLSDGLSAVSVFRARKAAPARVFQGVSQMGAVHAYGRLQGTVHITVVGEAPQETVRLIGESLQGEPLPEAAPSVAAAPSSAVPDR